MNLIEEMERENWSSEYDKEVVKLTSAFPDLKSLKDEDYCYINHFALKHTNEGDYILDVGCGIGLLCNLLKKYNRKPVGIDVSTLAVETAKNNVEGVAFNQMYCEQLDYQGGLFDCVTCTEVIEHLKEPGVAIGEMLRVLKPRGKLIITTPIGKNFDCDGKSKHLHYWDLYKLMDLFDSFKGIYKIYYLNKFKQFNEEVDEPEPKNIFGIVFVKGG